MLFLASLIFRLPEDKRESLKLNTAIVSIELHPLGGELLLGYAGGTAIAAQPQPIPVAIETPPVVTTENTHTELSEKTEETEATTAEKKPGEEPEAHTESPEAANDKKEEEAKPEEKKEEGAAASGGGESSAEKPKPATSTKKSKTGDRHVAGNLQAIRAQATEKFRTFSRTIKSKIDHTLNEDKSAVPTLPVPPSPRVIRLLPYTQGLCCATWRITSALLAPDCASNAPLEALVAYDDGAYLIWNIPKSESETEEPVIAVNQEVASIPYGRFSIPSKLFSCSSLVRKMSNIAFLCVSRTSSMYCYPTHCCQTLDQVSIDFLFRFDFVSSIVLKPMCRF